MNHHRMKLEEVQKLESHQHSNFIGHERFRSSFYRGQVCGGMLDWMRSFTHVLKLVASLVLEEAPRPLGGGTEATGTLV